jgi:S-adenosylmethionine:tRNA ribosyltransferase-isomerase
MKLDLVNNSIEHLRFDKIVELLNPGDTIVVNDTRVVNARLLGHKPTGGRIELLVLEPHTLEQVNTESSVIAECLVKGKVRPPIELEIEPLAGENQNIKAKVLEQISGGKFKVEFNVQQPMDHVFSKYGLQPLPPYIKQDLESPERYQTVYSSSKGSVAAPTAGLHFTPEILTKLEKNGVQIAKVTLHISYGTFIPVRTEDISRHKMDKEYAILTQDNAEKINCTINNEQTRLVAVGTTAVRTLETVAKFSRGLNKTNKLSPWEGWTELFIYPGFEFRSGIDILITNFHLPKSTLLMLVSAYAGRENILKAYQTAINMKYRFYSLGDTMMIIK